MLESAVSAHRRYRPVDVLGPSLSERALMAEIESVCPVCRLMFFGGRHYREVLLHLRNSHPVVWDLLNAEQSRGESEDENAANPV